VKLMTPDTKEALFLSSTTEKLIELLRYQRTALLQECFVILDAKGSVDIVQAK
jgi:hypothetical protein